MKFSVQVQSRAQDPGAVCGRSGQAPRLPSVLGTQPPRGQRLIEGLPVSGGAVDLTQLVTLSEMVPLSLLEKSWSVVRGIWTTRQ